MYEAFLAAARTIPCCIRDFADWHKGVTHYGFWAVLVDDPAWLRVLESARGHVAPYVHPGYRRAPHITVAACGLMSEQHFSARLREQQAAALAGAGVGPFTLVAGALDSFASAPYLGVEDPGGSLRRLRSVLAAVTPEDQPPDHRPHVTLGLYRGAFGTSEVADHLRGFTFARPLTVSVNAVAFCAYETRDIQGPFEVLLRVPL